tara:strand:+ start:52 stop:180 length:129 start_codon:yes stop_codon:yes gene_type:complete
VDIKEIKEKFNLPISVGNGKSKDTPIVIDYKEKIIMLNLNIS